MFDPVMVIALICLYMGGLFFIALRVEQKAHKGVNLVNNPVVYSLSLAVYCTSWTFYGSVGNAARYGMLFVTFYLGPMLLIAFWKTVLGKLVRIKNAHRITSLADFISARYDKSEGIAALATIIIVVGITPYIALQLKAILTSFEIITGESAGAPAAVRFVIVSLLILFTIVFGVRRLDPTERHQGMVMAVAVESMVKLTALLAVGVFVTYFMFDGVDDIFARLAKSPVETASGAGPVPFSMWTTYLVLSMSAILFLPRQFHVAVVENFDKRHIGKAMWLFPAYMLLTTLFVYPIATGGLLRGYPLAEADFLVLKLPFEHGSRWLSLFVFVGGFSAAASMIMIEAMTLSTMISNHLLLPLFDRARPLAFLRRHLLYCRWLAVAGCILTGYWFARKLGSSYFLASMGMLSFAAVLQFAPAVLGGIFWKKGNKAGAYCGLCAGFLVWLYTLLVPAFIKTGWMPEAILREGPFSLGLLRPESLLGVTGLDPLSHAVFWSLAANIGLYVFGSLYFTQSEEETMIAADFVDVMSSRPVPGTGLKKAAAIELNAKLAAVRDLLRRYLSSRKADKVLARCIGEAGLSDRDRVSLEELVELSDKIETTLAGSIGASAAHHAVRQAALVTPEERKELSRLYGEILADLKLPPAELKRKIDYHQEREALLKQQALELEVRVRERTIELVEANEKLKELDAMKSAFLSTVSHELRTPLTSVLGFARIIRKKLDEQVLPAMDKGDAKAQRAAGQIAGNLNIIIAEGHRLTTLINDVLDLAKMEAGKIEWRREPLRVEDLINHAGGVVASLCAQKGLAFTKEVEEGLPALTGDRDRLIQVMINLLSNAVKFTQSGTVACRAARNRDELIISVIDSGIGIASGDLPKVFEKFKQIGDTLTNKPKGTGLGLPICRQIVERHGGRLWVESALGKGSAFSFSLPFAQTGGGGGYDGRQG